MAEKVQGSISSRFKELWALVEDAYSLPLQWWNSTDSLPDVSDLERWRK
jgi:hypothetical protein